MIYDAATFERSGRYLNWYWMPQGHLRPLDTWCNDGVREFFKLGHAKAFVPCLSTEPVEGAYFVQASPWHRRARIYYVHNDEDRFYAYSIEHWWKTAMQRLGVWMGPGPHYMDRRDWVDLWWWIELP